jgi:hypothetical protein
MTNTAIATISIVVVWLGANAVIAVYLFVARARDGRQS